MNFKWKKDRLNVNRDKQYWKELNAAKPSKSAVINDEIKQLTELLDEFDSSKCEVFSDFPLSKKTLKGLAECKYEKPTDIQRESLGLALNGNDVLGAAKTGSGKTLAFILPVLENLFKLKWSHFDGLGALIISPTRELAFQTFEVLKKVGRNHDLSAGLVIGGKPLKEEAGRINRTNIVVCTPGRLLQHMDETAYFSADSLKILVLDEADRILDLGFAQTMNAIIENLPPERQTMLFSATQTRSVKDLARLSLHDPMYVSVHENAIESTPTQLEQNYVVCELHDKLNMLWSFLKNHLKSKILVFLTSCKQVKYVHEALGLLQPGIPVLALHGGMPQLRRVEVYNKFMVKQRVCLIATDIAARGLDFPAVNWVLQLDCPEDGNTYIHRAGRTARYEKDGESLLVLMPSEEEAMVKQLKDKKIPIEKIRINQQRLYSIQPKLEANCAADHELKALAQRAFVTYLRSIFLMKDKNVFDVHALDIEKYARSLGLAIAPKVRFLKRDQKRKEEKAAKKAQSTIAKLTAAQSKDDNSDGDDDENDSNSESSSDDENKSKVTKSNVPSLDSNKISPEKVKQQKDKINTNASSAAKNLDSKSELTKIKKVDEKIDDDSDSSDSSESDDDDNDSTDNDENESESENGDTDDNDDDDSDESSDSETDNIKEKSRTKIGDSEFNFDVNDDDGLYTVKKNVDIDEILGDKDVSTEVEESKSKKRRKALKENKELQALKLWRKNIKVNTKVTFDEEGQKTIDPHKVPQTEAVPDDPEEIGGINIALAKKRMEAEDKIDKEIYREKIRQKHREQRLKRKEEMREQKRNRSKQYDEFEVRLPSGDEDDNNDDDDGDFDDDNDSNDDDNDTDDERPPSKKVKYSKKLAKQYEDSDEDDSDDDDDDDDDSDDDNDHVAMDTELSLKDDEEMALRLLQGK
ncbi:ATP-dependent RNA helicase [Mactra antiquata]